MTLSDEPIRNLSDRLGFSGRRRERPVLTLLTDSLGHFAGRHELLLNGVELDHLKADCRVRPVSVFC